MSCLTEIPGGEVPDGDQLRQQPIIWSPSTRDYERSANCLGCRPGSLAAKVSTFNLG